MPSSISMTRSRMPRVGGLLDSLLAGEAPEGFNMTQGMEKHGRRRSREDKDGKGSRTQEAKD